MGEASTAQLYQCQNPGCDIVLQFGKMLPLEKLGEGYMECFYPFLQLHVDLQLSQKKKKFH